MAPKERERERNFKYERRSAESFKERANMRGGNFDSFIKSKYKLYKVRDGKNLVRILPPTWPTPKHYAYSIWVNYSIGVDNQSYLSLSKMKGEKDPLAEARRDAEREGDKKLIQALQPRQRMLMWVIDRLDEDEGPQLWPSPFTVDTDIVNLCRDEDTKEIIWIDDPDTGNDLRFDRSGQGLKTKYDASKMRILKPSPLCEDEAIQAEWLDYIKNNPVPDCLQFYDYEHISQVFNGQAGRPDDDDDDKEERPRRSRARDDDEEKPAPRRASRDDDDDEDRPRRSARPADDDDEDEPKPRSRAKVDDDEDDDADDKPEPEAAGSSIRDRLKRRRTAAAKGDDED